MEWIIGVAQIALAGGIVWLFREKISDLLGQTAAIFGALARLIDREWRIKVSGTEVEARRAEAQQAITEDVRHPTLPAPTSDPLPAVPSSVPPPLTTYSSGPPAFMQLRAFLGERVATIPPAEQLNTVLDALTVERLKFNHEFVYNRIFGSQLNALRQLLTVDHATDADARRHFQEYVVPLAPEFYKTFPYERWVGFLVRTGLVDQEGDTYRINAFGIDFLHYLVIARFPENKPF
jgi:hypothetical protein